VYRRAGEAQFFHMDAYRIESAPEGEELDLDTMLNEGPLLIEWADRLAAILPAERMWLQLEHVSEEARQMRFTACGKRYDAMLSDLRRSIFGGD
jgi:tRNA threonylcarbamoyladenosine biosynthesis protein TsaE